MAAPLTPNDVTRLMAEPSPEVRAEIAGKVAGTLNGDSISTEEVALAQDIVRILARDVEVRCARRCRRGGAPQPNAAARRGDAPRARHRPGGAAGAGRLAGAERR